MYHTLTGQLEYARISLNKYKYCWIWKFIYVKLHVFMLVWNVGISMWEETYCFHLPFMFVVLFVGMGNTSLQSEHTLSCLHLFNVTSNWIIYFISPYHMLHYIT